MTFPKARKPKGLSGSAQQSHPSCGHSGSVVPLLSHQIQAHPSAQILSTLLCPASPRGNENKSEEFGLQGLSTIFCRYVSLGIAISQNPMLIYSNERNQLINYKSSTICNEPGMNAMNPQDQ